MDIEVNSYKKVISERYGIPICLLDGETVEEIDSKTLALVSYKEGFDVEKVLPGVQEESPEDQKEMLIKTIASSQKKNATREQFAIWMSEILNN